MSAALVFDVGGTHLRCAVAGENGDLSQLQKKRIHGLAQTDQASRIWDELVADIVAYADGVVGLVEPDAPMVISFPGPVENSSVTWGAPTVVGSVGTLPDLRAWIGGRTGRKVHLLNDISAAAWRLGETTSADRFMVVTVSTGIGSKVYDRTHPMRVLDNLPFAGEIGHIVVDAETDAPPCDCGGKGHLGAISSGRGMERYARRHAARVPHSFERSVCARIYRGTADTLTNERHIVPAVLDGDPWAVDIVRRCTLPLAKTLFTVSIAVGLEKIIVIGGFAQALGQVYLRILTNLMQSLDDHELLSGKMRDLVQIENPASEVCLEGAAVFLRRRRPNHE